jgi:hypothetical protein
MKNIRQSGCGSRRLFTFVPTGLFDSIAPHIAEIRTVAKSLPQNPQNPYNTLYPQDLHMKV